MVPAAGTARFEGACVEDFGTFGKGTLDVLQWIADAASGRQASVAETSLFKRKTVQHIGVYAGGS
jgi:hypothetical protein